MYNKHFKQNLKVWKWYEYDESPLLVSLQIQFFNLLFPIARVYFFIIRKIK